VGFQVDLLQELPAEEQVSLGAQPHLLGCCALGSLGTCLGCTFTCHESF
jgi:hypothetical protein